MANPPGAASQQAATFMQQSMHEEAIGSLRYALASVQKSLSNHQLTSTRLGNPSPNHESMKIISMRLEDTRPSEENTNMFKLFNEAFIFTESKPTQSFEILQVQSAILLFDMGLAYHKQGLRYSETEALLSALRIYRACLDVIDQIASSSVSTYDTRREMNHVLLAVLNNLGHLHFHFADRPSVLRCGEILSYVLSSGDFSKTALDNPQFLQYVTTLVFSFDSSQVLTVSPAA